MKAAVLHGFGEPFQVEEVPIPAVGAGEALVRVRASGLCASDLHIIDGDVPSVRLPFWPGHELAGEVVEVGPALPGKPLAVKPGDRVVSLIDVTCGTCGYCLKGATNLCRHLKRTGFERSGSHAEYAVVPAANLRPIPEGLPWAEAAIVPDAVASAHHALVTRGMATPGEVVVVIGAGGLGLHAVQMAVGSNMKVYALDIRRDALDKAAAWGATAVQTDVEDPVDRIKAETDGLGADLVLDHVGTERTIQQAVAICRPGGRVMVVGYHDRIFPIPSYDVMLREKALIGTRGNVAADLDASLQLIAEGKVQPLVSRTYPLSNINQAVDDLRAGRILGRAVILMDGPTQD